MQAFLLHGKRDKLPVWEGHIGPEIDALGVIFGKDSLPYLLNTTWTEVMKVKLSGDFSQLIKMYKLSLLIYQSVCLHLAWIAL